MLLIVATIISTLIVLAPQILPVLRFPCLVVAQLGHQKIIQTRLCMEISAASFGFQILQCRFDLLSLVISESVQRGAC